MGDNPNIENQDPSVVHRAGEALGQFFGLAETNRLGSLGLDGAIDKASLASASPEAVACSLGIPLAYADTLDMSEVRERLMSSYYAAEAADDFVESKESFDRFRENMINGRRDLMYRSAAVTPDQADRIRFDADNGDMSALNRVREQFFFE